MGRKMTAILALLLLVPAASQADAPLAEVRSAQAFLQTGDAARALEAFRELLVDYPDAPSVQFGIACAQLQLGENALAMQNPAEATAALNEARSGFQTLQTDASEAVRRESGYNLGNSLVQLAQTMDEEQGYPQKVTTLRQAIAAYEEVLAAFPDHEGARQNLDYARLALKELLQREPEQPEQEPQEQPEQEPQPKLFSIFNDATTEIPGAAVVPEDQDILKLVPPAQRSPQ